MSVKDKQLWLGRLQETLQNICRCRCDRKFSHGVFAQMLSANLVGLRDLDKIRVVAKIGFGVVALIEELLPLSNHAQILVVHDDHLDGQAETADRSQLLDVHLEAAIARNAEHGAIWLGKLASNGPRQSETHCAQSARGDESTRGRRAVTLRCPHLVLAHVGQDYAVLRQPAEELVQKKNRRLRQASGVKLGTFRSASDRAPIAPVGQRDMAQRAVAGRNGLSQIADHR